jgi:hypothetical protein
MADDELDALNALEKEASEFNKVCDAFVSMLSRTLFTDVVCAQDAEIDRIRKAFPLDA